LAKTLGIKFRVFVRKVIKKGKLILNKQELTYPIRLRTQEFKGKFNSIKLIKTLKQQTEWNLNAIFDP